MMNHQRLRQLRLARGMTLSDLAQATNNIVTRQAISKYEHGQATPSPTVLQRLAQALGVRPTDLLNGQEVQIELIAYRKRASLRKRQHDQIAALVDETLRERLRLQHLIGEVSYLNVPLHHYPVADLADAETAANELRVRWDLGSAPIANLTDVLEDHGLHVIALDTVDGFDGVAAVVRDEHDTPVAAAVIARRTADGARWRMNLAHELGHLVLQPQGNLDEEKAAFRFAAALLAPASNLRAFIGTRRHHIHLDELILLKHHFGMSIQALLYRMLTLEIISQRLYRSLMIELSERGWRTQEPEPLPLEEPIWLRRAVLRALAEELIDPAEAQRLLSGATTIPVDQPEMGRCQQLLHQPLPERHAILAAQAETARDLYQVTATPAREVITSEYS
jgi:Zn-dependent peptidase ImmA (M78 family)/DNA-binding XRE family transcriptional regulator